MLNGKCGRCWCEIFRTLNAQGALDGMKPLRFFFYLHGKIGRM